MRARARPGPSNCSGSVRRVIVVPLRLRRGLEDREENELAPTINLPSSASDGQIQEERRALHRCRPPRSSALSAVNALALAVVVCRGASSGARRPAPSRSRSGRCPRAVVRPRPCPRCSALSRRRRPQRTPNSTQWSALARYAIHAIPMGKSVRPTLNTRPCRQSVGPTGATSSPHRRCSNASSAKPKV
jgi:hypothetical protein